MEALCYCDLDWPLLIRIFDYQPNEKHRLIGSFETTLQLLMDNISAKGNADRDAAFDILKQGEDANTGIHTRKGLVVVVKADYVERAN
jgi:hypothetical protein